jgi:hypothetical protein
MNMYVFLYYRRDELQLRYSVALNGSKMGKGLVKWWAYVLAIENLLVLTP